MAQNGEMNPINLPFTYTDNDFINVLKSSKSPASLFNTTLVSISRSLWLQDNMRLEIINSCTFYNPNELSRDLNKYKKTWSKIARKVIENIPKSFPICWRKTLEKTVDFVGEQILHFLYHRLCLELDGKKINIYLDNLRWSSQGMIDEVKTTSLLLEHEGLSTLEKYELACSICSEEKIHYYLSKLPEQFINMFIEVNKFKLMVYWTLHLKGELKRHDDFNMMIENESESRIIKYVFEWAYFNRNEAAARYFLINNNSVQENVTTYITSCIVGDTTFLLPYLMVYMTPNQLQELCVNDGYLLLNRLAKDWRLKSYFVPTAKYILQFITEMNLHNAFKIILLCWKENVLENRKCKDLLHEFVHHVKPDNKMKQTSIISILLNPLFSLEAFETIKLLLRKFPIPVKSNVIYSSFGMKTCSNLILERNFSEVEFFLQEMLKSKPNIRKFKSNFFQNNSFELSFKLITLGNYQILDNFLKSFSYDEEIKRFKLELPYKFRAAIITNIFKCSSSVCSDQPKAIDEFLYWCFEGDVSKISDCKLEVFEINSKYKELQEQVFQQIFELIIKGKFQLLNKYLNWSYCTNDKILKFKSEFFKKKNFEICYNLIVNDKYELLDEFLNVFCVKDEISTYKYTLPIGREGKIIKEFLKLRNSTVAAESIIRFLNYSFDKNEKVITYLKEQVVDQGKDINIDCLGIFFEKIPLIGNSLLRDKYMKWAFSTDVKPEVEVDMQPSPENGEHPFNNQFPNIPFTESMGSDGSTQKKRDRMTPNTFQDERLNANTSRRITRNTFQDERLNANTSRRMTRHTFQDERLNANTSRAWLRLSESIDRIRQSRSRNPLFLREHMDLF